MKPAFSIMAMGVLVFACGDSEQQQTSSHTSGEVLAADPQAGTASDLKTSAPSAATVEALRELDGSLEVLLFFPPGPVSDQVAGYVGALEEKAGVALAIREIDRLAEPALARSLRVNTEGTIVLVRGDHRASVVVYADEQRAARNLEQLDTRVRAALVELGTAGRALVWSHEQPGATAYERSGVTQALEELGYEVDVTTRSPDPSLARGADLIVCLDAGARPSAEALERVAAHVGAGGAALVALEPRDGAGLGALGTRLGVRFDPTPVADDEAYVQVTRAVSDRANLLTDRIAEHGVTSMLSRASKRTGLTFLGAGSFEPAGDGTSAVFPVRTRSSAFRDDGDFSFDVDREQRAELALVSAFDGSGTDAGRAVLFADASWLDDRALKRLPLNQALLAGALRWLGGDAASLSSSAAPRTPADLTTYPRRPDRGSAPAPGHVWTVSADSIARVEYRSDRGHVILEGGDEAGALRGTERRSRAGGADETFTVSRGAELVNQLATLRFVRPLGVISHDRRADFGLGRLDASRLVVEHADGRRELLVGDRVPGAAHRYALEPDTGHAYVVPGVVFQRLEGGAARMGER